MTIKLRAYGIGLHSGLNGSYELAEGTTVEQAILSILKDAAALEPVGGFHGSVLLINKKRAERGSVLHDGDELSVLRTMSGG